MSDDKSHPPENQAHEQADAEVVVGKSTLSTVTVMVFVIMALIGALLFVAIRKNMAAPGADDRLKELRADVAARAGELNRQRVSLGLSPLPAGSEPMDNIAKRLKNDADTLVALAGRFQEMLAEKDLLINAKNEEILNSERLRQTLVNESGRLQTELNRALVQGSGMDALRNEVASLRSQRDAIASELNAALEKAKTLTAGVSPDEFADLQRRFSETLRAKEFFEARVKQLEGDLSKAKLFASSENELLPAAVELFRNLRELEGRPDSELTTSYSSIGVKLGANVLKTLPFVTGSSNLSPEDSEAVKNMAAELPDGDLLLVIGYASETGNVDNNRKLSSDRATAVAALYSTVKRPAQLVQAVYLGQTDRFSSRIPERNQLCEIWRIRKK